MGMAVGCGEIALGSGVPTGIAVGNGPGPPGVAVETGVAVGNGVAVEVGGTEVAVAVGEGVLVEVDGTEVTVTVGAGGVAVAVPVGRLVEVGGGVTAGLWDDTASSGPGLEAPGGGVCPPEQAVAMTVPTATMIKSVLFLSFISPKSPCQAEQAWNRIDWWGT